MVVVEVVGGGGAAAAQVMVKVAVIVGSIGEKQCTAIFLTSIHETAASLTPGFGSFNICKI